MSTGGPWSTQEKTRHINCLELLSSRISPENVHEEREGLIGVVENRQHDGGCYINNQGGTVSHELVHLTRYLWMWCLERNSHIHAEHLPGRLNTVADRELRSMKDSDGQMENWMWEFSKESTRPNQIGPLEVDLFASRLTHQCRCYFSWRLDPFAEATDAFTQDWSRMKGLANPPWNLHVIAKVLAKTNPGSQHRLDCTSVEVTTIVSTPTSNASRPSMSSSSSGGCDSSPGTSAGRVEHLRKRFRDQQLSTQATELILK